MTVAIRILVAVALSSALSGPLAAQTAAPTAPPAKAPVVDEPRDKLRSDELFGHGLTPDLKLVLDDAAREALRKEPRKYVKATLREGERAVGVVGIKLKGAAGSFQEFDARPGITIDTDKFTKGLTFHGLSKFHLNNAAQDDTLLCEWLGGEVFRAAGYPACRVTHAHFVLDDRDLGIYVLKEGFDTRFLLRNFGTADGSLYDGGFCQEIDAELEKDHGDPQSRADLQALAKACHIESTQKRAQALPAVLDLEAFVTFAALERMLVHWDGYVQNTNNYRVWIAADGRARFLPHGMDQLLGDIEATVLATPETLAGRAVLKLPEWRARYRARLVELLPVLRSAELRKRYEAAAARLKKLAAKRDGDGGAAQAERARDLLQRFDARARQLERELKAPEPKAIELAVGAERPLTDWLAARATENAVVTATPIDGTRAYKVTGSDKAPCTGSWRCGVLLPKGRYRFDAKVRGKDIAGGDGNGVQLRRSGVTAEHSTLGTFGWQVLSHEFAVEGDTQEIVLVAELHAATGQVWFRRDSFKLVRLPD